MKKKKNKLIPGIFIFALLAGAAAYGVWAGNQTEETASVQTATVTIGSLSSTLGSSGNSRSSQSANITWSTTGKVGEVSLQAGDQVQEDQVLAALDPNTLSSDIANAKLDLINAQEALDDLLNSKLQQAQALQAVEDTQVALNNIKVDAAEQSRQALLALAEAQETYDSAVKTRTAMNYPHTSDELVIEKAETDYLLAKTAYKEALKEYQKYEKKNLTNADRVRALNNLVAAQ